MKKRKFQEEVANKEVEDMSVVCDEILDFLQTVILKAPRVAVVPILRM